MRDKHLMVSPDSLQISWMQTCNSLQFPHGTTMHVSLWMQSQVLRKYTVLLKYSCPKGVSLCSIIFTPFPLYNELEIVLFVQPASYYAYIWPISFSKPKRKHRMSHSHQSIIFHSLLTILWAKRSSSRLNILGWVSLAPGLGFREDLARSRTAKYCRCPSLPTTCRTYWGEGRNIIIWPKEFNCLIFGRRQGSLWWMMFRAQRSKKDAKKYGVVLNWLDVGFETSQWPQPMCKNNKSIDKELKELMCAL